MSKLSPQRDCGPKRVITLTLTPTRNTWPEIRGWLAHVPVVVIHISRTLVYSSTCKTRTRRDRIIIITINVNNISHTAVACKGEFRRNPWSHSCCFLLLICVAVVSSVSGGGLKKLWNTSAVNSTLWCGAILWGFPSECKLSLAYNGNTLVMQRVVVCYISLHNIAQNCCVFRL